MATNHCCRLLTFSKKNFIHKLRACGSSGLLITRCSSSKSNSDYAVNTEFINRNPRNLESMGLAYKTEGWTFQYPPKDYYNKLIFEVTNRNTIGYVEHWSGRRVVTASTQEWPIKKQLYSCTDMVAAECIGKVLAERCLQAGLTQVYYEDEKDVSPKLKTFLEAIQSGDVELSEPERIRPEIVPGTDYGNPNGNRYAEKKKWKDDLQVIS